MSELCAVLQLADAAFPAGGFGHSFGLETAIVEGRVASGATLHAWIESYLLAGCARLDGAAMMLLLRDGASIDVLDERLRAAQPNAEIRRANAHLARATLDTYVAMGLTDQAGGAAGKSIAEYHAAIATGRSGGVHVLATALGYQAIAVQPAVALEAHATTIVTACASVAARAIPLGQREIARVRWTLRTAIGEFVTRATAVRAIDDLRTSAVACEIDGLRHRRLPARMFAS